MAKQMKRSILGMLNVGVSSTLPSNEKDLPLYDGVQKYSGKPVQIRIIGQDCDYVARVREEIRILRSINKLSTF